MMMSPLLKENILKNYQSIGYEIAKIHKALRSKLQSILEPYGITVQQFEVMRVLGAEEVLTAAQLVDHLISDSSTIMSILKNLESKGMLERQPDERDHRIKRINLTEKGNMLLSQSMLSVLRHNTQMHERCTDNELAILRHVFAKLHVYAEK